MIPPDSELYIYELKGEVGNSPAKPPRSFIGLWNEEGFSYLFFIGQEDQYVADLLARTGATQSSLHVMKYRDWQTGMPQQGISLGGVRFVPTDHPSPPPSAIRLDPSVVFGDGVHPTTTACLERMERLIAAGDVAGVLDLGTGTGILALAAAALGAKRVLAVDRNSLAVATARDNVERNSLSEVIRVEEGEARCFIDAAFDLVAANLPFQVLRDLIPLRGTSLQRAWIVSGINAAQAQVLRELFADQDFECCDERVDHPWVTFVAVNRKHRGCRRP